MVAEFQPFPKIPRLRRDCIITEKIDGTNAQIYITDEGEIHAASRTRWIIPQSDNFGFATWVEQHKDELLALGPGRHFGEWYGSKIQRGYGLTERRFALFNVHRWFDVWNAFYGVIGKDEPPSCCQVVPVLHYGRFSDSAVNVALDYLRECGSCLAAGFMNPEGVVVHHTASGTLYKVTLENDEAPKGKVA